MGNEFQLLDGARSLLFPGVGTFYADKRGRVKVSDEMAAAIRGSAAKRRYDAIIEVVPGRYANAVPDGLDCSCGFSPWAWQSACPRCGAALERP